nr:secreted Ly-6/uPAR domain-containing protein 2 [Marmota flaviventris]
MGVALQEAPTCAPSVCLSAATAQGLRCHLCKGFGGCSHVSNCPRGSTHCVIIATRSPISFQDLPLVTKMCYNGCPDVPSLGLGPHVSIACCQSSLCNHD